VTRACRLAGIVFAVLVVAACGGTARPASHPLAVIAKPKVDTSGLPGAELSALRAHGAIFSSPTEVAFMTTGTTSCVWLPVRLVVLGSSSIRFDMRVNGDVERCSSGAVGFPIAVTIDPKLVDVHRSLTVLLAYKVTVGGHTRTSHKRVTAPALGSS
jgi:hypothetical protein